MLIKPVVHFLDDLFPSERYAGAKAVELEQWQPDESGTYCGRCGATSAAAAITETGCGHCRGQRVAWHGIWRLGAYEPPLSEWIVHYKFQGMYAWGRWLGRALAERTPDDEQSVVTPVPLHWVRRMRRGYDQAHLIALAFAAAKGLPVARVLRRRRATLPQSHLHSHLKRRNNIRAAFTAAPVDLTGWTVWLIDDVKTSGTTLQHCTRMLQRLGAKRVNVAVAAVADPKGAGFTRNQAPPTS